MNQFSPTDLPRIDFRSIAVPGTSNTRQRQPPGVQQSHSAPGEIASSPQGLDNPALLRDMLLANPHELSLLKERNPPLADALLSGDLGKLIKLEGRQADLRQVVSQQMGRNSGNWSVQSAESHDFLNISVGL